MLVASAARHLPRLDIEPYKDSTHAVFNALSGGLPDG